MGLFDRLKGKGVGPVSFPAALGAPVEGTFVSMDQIPDEVFSTGVLGTCCGVDPVVGNIYAPIDGRISQLADTLHAVGLEAGGMEILPLGGPPALAHRPVTKSESAGSYFGGCGHPKACCGAPIKMDS